MVTRTGDREIGVVSGRVGVYVVSFVQSFNTLYPNSDQKTAQLASKRQNS